MNKPELLAAFWTLAGDIYPGSASKVSPYSLQARVEAAAKAGWKGIALSLPDLQFTLQKLSISDVRQLFKDNDIKYFEMEILKDWYLEGEERLISDNERKKIMDLGGELGMRTLKIGAKPQEDSVQAIEKISVDFSKLCQDAMQINANIALEIMPFSRFSNLEDGLKIVDTGDMNGGLCLDIWHLSRGNIDFKKIKHVPAHLIKSVELNDAKNSIHGSLFNDSIHHRKLCGEGDFDITNFLHEIKSAGFNQPYLGVEIISKDHRNLTLNQMAQSAYDSAVDVINKVLN